MWWTLWACGVGETPCSDGFERAADGNCYPVGDDDDDHVRRDSGRTWGRDSGDPCTTTDPGPTLVEAASVVCTGTQLTVDAESQAWISLAVVHLRDNANSPYWSENHELTSYAFDPCGRWDRFDVDLDTGASVATWQPDVSTVFTCSHVDDDQMSYAIGIWDFDGNFADCIAWGFDPQEILDNPSGDVGESVDFSVRNCVIAVPAR
ncbi:MAG: hypothetical protein H6738_04525 [Alphaproteobacteria bacterium]|nr:hypothetical protein [Alphaproteobacteria bacterium]MCB9696038.1 hypothetical protein [Alphaproteobacteria bacterium]